MATVIAKVATVPRQMANDFEKVATVPAEMATPAQFIEAISIKAVIKCIGRDGNKEYSFRRNEK